MVTVTNNTSSKVEVAVNQWGNDGDTNYFSIGSNGGKETWSRSDGRGFIMSLKYQGETLPYYIFSDSNITIGSDGVIRDNSVLIKSCGRGQ